MAMWEDRRSTAAEGKHNRVSRKVRTAMQKDERGMNTTPCLRRLSLILLCIGLLPRASAQYEDWNHAGSLYLVTTPEGADLPASALEENFPLLVRLDRDFFDFSQADPRGEDVRFSSNGNPLAYQIESWDPAEGNAAVRSEERRVGKECER